MDINFIQDKCEEASITLVIDSELRDKQTYPTPNHYVVEFAYPIKNVSGFEILDAALPVSRYSVETDSSSIAFGVFISNIINNTNIYSHIENTFQYDADFQEIFESEDNGNIFVVIGEDSGDIVENMYPQDNANIGTNLIFACVYTDDNNIQIVSKKYVEYAPNIVQNSNGVITLTSSNNISINIDYIISLSYINVQPANYDSSSMLKYLRQVNFLNNVMSFFIPTNIILSWYDDVPINSQSLTQKYTWTLNSTYTFFLDAKKSSMASILGFSEPNSKQPFKYKDNIHIYTSSIVDKAGYTTNALTSPGVLVFQGTKYITLRCPELESQILKQYSNLRQIPGLGVFKLTTTNTISFVRFDYASLKALPFHPIGKLSKLTFSFVDKYGHLYDFKGMDHVFLVSIKYYIPKREKHKFISHINPQYNPNILEYQLQQLDNIPNKKKQYSNSDIIREHNKYLKK